MLIQNKSAIEYIDERLKAIESRIQNSGYEVRQLVESEVKKRWTIPPQSDSMFALHTALVVDTQDPLIKDRVRFFSPALHQFNTPIASLPWANPITNRGGFDDCGGSWIPPAGSTLCILFEDGSRRTPYYIGTTWHRDRGSDGQHNWNFNIAEYYQIHEGHRKQNYYIGDKTGAQVYPPWNTENRRHFDVDTLTDYEKDTNAQNKSTYPHIYGDKTPQKHTDKRVDGDYKCNHKGKRWEQITSCGGAVVWKDDHLHPAGNWVHPDALGGTADDECDENTTCKKPDPSKVGTNKYFKCKNEARPYIGPRTPQNNKIELEQSGYQILAISGHTFGMDDSVEEPTGIPNWERSLDPFDFGCTNVFTGKTFWISATGHKIVMSDKESNTNLRGEENFIKIITASGNSFEMNDHTESQGISGAKRGIFLRNTCNAVFEMVDEENNQASPDRREGGEPKSLAKRARITMRTGYGLEFSMNDFQPASTRNGTAGIPGSQQETINQNIQIFSPQKDNTKRGPHILRFTEKKDGPGQMFVRVGGQYICSTYDSHLTVVGNADNPADKVENVSKSNYIQTKKAHYHEAEVHALVADEAILLLAGKDCPPAPNSESKENVPCVGRVLVYDDARGAIVLSDRLFASFSKRAAVAPITGLAPFRR